MVFFPKTVMDFDEYQLEVPGKDAPGVRLDKYIAGNLPNISRTKVQRAISDGTVTVNKMTEKASYPVRSGDIIEVRIPVPPKIKAKPERMELDIVFEDDDLIIVNKSGDRVIHPAHGHWSGTLVNGLLWHADQLSKHDDEPIRPGIVHRLDKDTSGLLVVAKNDETHRILSSYFQDQKISRTYWALVWGTPEPEEDTITGNIGRSSQNRKKMAVVPDEKGKHAVTHYKVLKYFHHLSLVEVQLETDVRIRFAFILQTKIIGCCAIKNTAVIRFVTDRIPAAAGRCLIISLQP